MPNSLTEDTGTSSTQLLSLTQAKMPPHENKCCKTAKINGKPISKDLKQYLSKPERRLKYQRLFGSRSQFPNSHTNSKLRRAGTVIFGSAVRHAVGVLQDLGTACSYIIGKNLGTVTKVGVDKSHAHRHYVVGNLYLN